MVISLVYVVVRWLVGLVVVEDDQAGWTNRVDSGPDAIARRGVPARHCAFPVPHRMCDQIKPAVLSLA
jgi:hypothetical protein